MAASVQLENSVLEKTSLKFPSRYRVIIHNDHYTTMEFVVNILVTVFQKNRAEADAIMIQVHKKGAGVAGEYSKEIAETKIEIVHSRAKEKGFPLFCSLEKI